MIKAFKIKIPTDGSHGDLVDEAGAAGIQLAAKVEAVLSAWRQFGVEKDRVEVSYNLDAGDVTRTTDELVLRLRFLLSLVESGRGTVAGTDSLLAARDLFHCAADACSDLLDAAGRP